MGYPVHVQIPKGERLMVKRSLLERELLRHESIMRAWRKHKVSMEEMQESLRRVERCRIEQEGMKG